MINPFRPSGNFAGGGRREGGIIYEIPKGANNIGDCVASFILKVNVIVPMTLKRSRSREIAENLEFTISEKQRLAEIPDLPKIDLQ